MCYFTYKFYECKHRGEDHIVKCEKKKNDGTGTHCNPDQRGYKSMPKCGIKLQDLEGLCRSCSALECKRLIDEAEAKAIQRDIEKARKQDLEEQRRKAEAHEAHMQMAKNDSSANWERQESQRLQQILRESRERQESEMSSHMKAAMETSRREYAAYMEESYGEAVEEGSPRDHAIKRKSTMDWHHPRWTNEDGMDELEAMTSSFSITENRTEVHRYSETHEFYEESSSTNIPPPPPPPPLSSASTGYKFAAKSIQDSKTSVSSSNAAPYPPPPPPPRPMPPASSNSGISAASLLNSKATLRASKTVDSSASTTSKPLPSPSGISTDMLATSARSLKSASSRTESTSRAPAAPIPSFPPVDYSQVPQDQNYGRFMIGTRHQPIHPSQETFETPASPTETPNTPVGPRTPIPAVRLAGSLTPTATRAPTAFQIGSGRVPGRLRPSASVKHPPPTPTKKDEVANELAALWARRGIQQDEEEDNVQAASQFSGEWPDRNDEDALGKCDCNVAHCVARHPPC